MNKTTIATFIILITLAIISLMPSTARAVDLDDQNTENENAEIIITDEALEEYERCVSRFKEEDCPSLERIAQVLEDRSRRVRRSCGEACALYQYSRITGRPYFR